jgi:hypothetical protein
MIKKEGASINVPEGVKVEKVLIENFVSLQHVMTNLVVKFDSLSSQISKLLELFEISAKVLAEKGVIGEERTDKKVAEKLDILLEQNKIIAKGLSLLHERNPEPQYTTPNQVMRPTQQRPPYNLYKNPIIRK